MENKKYSLLIIALYCYSGHVRAVIDHLKTKNPLVDLTLLTEKPEEMKNMLLDKSVNIVHYNVAPVSLKNRWLRFLLIKYKQRKFFSSFCEGKNYDIVNIHFPNRYMSYVYGCLRKITQNIVLTPWGSDVLRVSNKKMLSQLGKLYRNADYIATDAKTPLGKKIIDELNVEPNKLVGNFFGTDVVDFALSQGTYISQEEAKQRFGLSGRYVITCGYNRRPVHQHKVMIEAIDKVRSLLPNNITLLFPMTYGPNTKDEYIEECKKECESRNLSSVFVTDYLSVEDLYKLRKCTDIFVHLQLTDASSGSVQEYILCDKKIVHGSWVKYEELESYKPLFYFPVNRIEDLGDVIVKACYSDNIKIPQGVFDYVKDSGWQNKATLMNDFFISIS